MTDEPEPPDAPPEPQPSTPAPTREPRASKRVAWDAAWHRFVPAFWLMGLLLASNVALAVCIRVWGDTLVGDAVVTALDAAIVGAFVLHEWPAVRAALRVRHLGWRDWLLAGGALVAIGVVVQLWFFIGARVFEILEVLEPFRENGWPPWSAVVLVVLCPAVVEELAFRGFLLERLEPLIGRRDALLLQAALFAILHMLPAMLPSHFWMGLVLGVVRIRTGSLVPCMCVHGAWNLFVLIEEGLLEAWP
ncbi:MAG TPA: type II CAAX endopeptidase family protein [Planctomycetota bacterium]